ncbi:iron complex transport system permease protein [Methanolobus vulcani]|uniref:Cobalamin import system permease protein BtuC n=2 Tax=Methanolobus vulcani TaxID=38026 RepID=A0A7Z7AYI4_9EURY|nr:iron complex transport system permease protein [Methanolobus vulcani]
MINMKKTWSLCNVTLINRVKLTSHLSKAPINFTLFLLLLCVLIIALFVGRYPIDPVTVVIILVAGIMEWIGNMIAVITGVKVSFFWSIRHTWPTAMNTVVWDVRLPRAMAVILAGSGLSVSGATYQGVFRNPLVSESILGVSAGAGVGAALAILMDQGNSVIQLSAFIFGLLAVGMTFAISRVYRSNPTLVLVLAGIIVGGLFSAIISLMKFVADPYSKLPDIVFWLMGSFSKASSANLLPIMPIFIIAMLIIILLRWQLNVLSMGDEEARSLGIDTKRFRPIVIVCSTLLTAAAVCIGGVIGWVGLIIPHISRMVVGPDHKDMIIASILLGGSYLLAVDTICRTLASVEIPISIITSILGAPIFLYLLYKAKKTWS